MTYQNDPNLNRPNRPVAGEETSYTGWIIGGVVALALVVGMFSMFGGDKTNTTATNNTPVTTTRPATTAPMAPTTTGSNVNSPAPAAPSAPVAR